MREIKFRGFDAVGKKGWVFGDLVHNMKVTTTGLEPRVMVGGYEVIPESVGQFTGLHDKNGKEIYEGDVVMFLSWFKHGGVGRWTRHVVSCRDASWSLASVDFQESHMLCGYHEDDRRRFDVIGNTHDNPELIKRDLTKQ